MHYGKSSIYTSGLYELIWTVPLSRLAKKFDISDNGLRKKCNKLNIPLPEMGYWQKVQYHKKVTRKKLPQNNPSGIEKVDLSERNDVHNPLNSPTSKIKNLKKSYNNLNQSIFNVQSKLSNPDKLVTQVQKVLSKSETNTWSKGLVHTNSGQIDINVSPSNVNRALCIYDSLIKLLRFRGHDLKVKNHNTYALLEGEEFEIALREKLRVEKTLDSNNWATNNYFPSGKLILKIGSTFKREFIDGTRTLEEMFPDILAHLEYIAHKKKEDRIQREIEWAKRQEEARIKKETEARKSKELEEVKILFNDSSSWHKSTILNNYIEEVEKRAIETNSMTEELKNWLVWAKQKADWYNPFIKKEDELLTDSDRLEF